MDLVRSICEKKSIPTGIKKILETISKHENIPRKKAKFLNFMQNSFRYMKINELEEAWVLLEEAMKENKEQTQQTNGNGEVKENGNGTKAQNGVKRKHEEEDEAVDEQETELVEEPKKKKSKKEVELEPESAEAPVAEDSVEEATKFKWTENIQAYLAMKARNKEVTLKKLRGKIMKKYKTFTGCDWSDKIERKFNKKINKLSGIVVDNEKVRLIE